MRSVINASAAGKTVVIHAFPGPAGINDPKQGGMFPTRGNMATHNTFHVAAWAGNVPVPEDPNSCRAVAAQRLVESLAPFLIVATERVFFGSECTLHLASPRCATLMCVLLVDTDGSTISRTVIFRAHLRSNAVCQTSGAYDF